jgi:hypothetical protein
LLVYLGSRLKQNRNIRYFKGTVSQYVYLWIFSSNNTRGSTDSWIEAVSNIDSYSRRYSTTRKSPIFNFLSFFFQFSILFYCDGVGQITYGPFLLCCCFNGSYKSRNIGILTICAVQKNLRALSRSHLCLQISLRIRNHMQKWFNPLISDQSGIDWCEDRGSKISLDCPFKAFFARSAI